MPILFIFTVRDEELLQTMLTDVAGMSGWTPWQEKGIQAFPIYSRSGDPKAADAIVGFISGSAIAVGSYERLQQCLAPPWTKY